MTSRAEAAGGGSRELAWLWFGFLGPPVLWAARLMAAYAVTPRACEGGGLVALHAITVAALAGSLFAGLVAFRWWRRAGRAGAGSGSAAEARTTGRSRFLALLGVLSSLMFSAVIVAEGLANVLVDPCLGAGSLL